MLRQDRMPFDVKAGNPNHWPQAVELSLLRQRKGAPNEPPTFSLARLSDQTFAANGLFTISLATGTSLVPSPALPVSTPP